MTSRAGDARANPGGTIWEIDEGKEEIEGLDASGRPDPAYAAALGMLPAPFGRRALALICDVVIWVVLQLPLWFGAVPLLLKLAVGSISPYGFLNHPDFVLAVVTASVTVALTLVMSIVQLVLHGRVGLTIGKAITGIRTVNVCTLARPGVGKVFLRYLLVCASNIVPVLGPATFFASSFFDPERRGRGWHDRATYVWLVDIRRGLNPYDDKRMRVARKLVKADPAPERSALPSLATPTDPNEQPQYRPGSRVSAGVIGVARPHSPEGRPDVGVAHSVPAPVGLSRPGTPMLGGYRQPGAEPAAAAPAPAPAPSPAPAPAPAPAPTPTVFGLLLDTGESIQATESLLLGRNPDDAVYPGARTVPLEDESRSISKTHLLVRPIDGGLEVVDCGSTNGSGLARDGAEYTITAGTPIMVIEGDTVRFGDRFAAVIRM